MGKRFITIGLLLCSAVYQVSAAYSCRKWFDKTSNTSSDYAVILVGGTEEAFVHEAAKAYQYLVNIKGCTKSKIRVYAQNGSNFDLDGDGVGDVNGAASSTNKDLAFSFLSTNSTTSNDVYISVIDHGAVDYIDLYNNGLYANYLSQKLSSINFKKATILLSACHSGSFIDNIKRNNVTIITTAPTNNYSWFSTYGDLFSHEFYKALGRGYKGEATVDADYNRDGQVSYEEAFVYAKDHDTNTLPTNSTQTWYTIPRYWSSDTPWRFCRDVDWGVQNTTFNMSSGTTNVEAMYLLNATGTISGSANVTLSSGKIIRLGKGFKVKQGARFRTVHIDCEAEKQANEAELRKFEIVEQEAGQEDFDIAVSPNPSEGKFTVSLGEVEAFVSIMDMKGRTVKTYNNATGDFEIDITEFPNGVYLLLLNSNTFKYTQKIVKY